MKPLLRSVGVLAAWAMIAVTPTAFAKKPETFKITGPTIIAFSRPVSQAEIDDGGDLSEALSDFQYYVDSLEKPLHEAGITLYETYTLSFQIQIKGKLHLFKNGKEGVGYYFITPGKKPQIQYGVMTDADILDIAGKYFRKPILNKP